MGNPKLTQLIGKTITINGTVQGVGFRPTVWRIAQQLRLIGKVWNAGDAVIIHVWGSEAVLTEFVQQIKIQAPTLAKITAIHCESLAASATSSDFQIIASQTGTSFTRIAADTAICSDCIADINDVSNRRYRYAFTNCTQCGPRFSIIQQLPYDRPNTAMAKFTLCPACQAEYDNPLDRRFHAQPNACPVCGPQLSLSDGKTQLCSGQQDVIAMTVDLIQQGHIIAIKGIGGFHLACDASNQQAVANLRQRKQRFAKPFAIMARDLISLQNWVSISALEQQQLLLSAAPIVILAKQGEILADGVAPGQNSLGCMLPYTALHHTLMHSLAQPIVLTSANRNEEPQCIDNQEALHRLTGIADYWLLHNRDIVNRLDDSVVRVIDQQPRLLRRARGYAPEPLPLSLDLKGIPPIIGMGGELKNSFCLLQEQQAILSPYIGDLENAFVQQDYRRMLALYQELFHFQPKIIAVDGHERYLSSQLGQQWAEDAGIKLVTVQHHHAHIAACMAEYGLALDHAPVLGVAMDGLGWGDDGQLWGGEFLQVDYRSYQRLASFQAIPMLGGSQAMVQPWRNTYAYLKQYFAWEELNEQFADLEIMQYLNQQPIAVLDQMLFKKLNSPVSSSCGRWFDAFAAALGVCREHTSYEGQAAISLETVAEPVFAQERGAAYAFELTNENGVRVLNWRTFWLSVLLDLQRKVDKAVIAARIHHGLAQAIAITAIDLARQMGTEIVVLSGGVFQNRLLLEEVSQLLRSANKQPLSPVELPCNDGGLALGQVVIAAAIIARLD